MKLVADYEFDTVLDVGCGKGMHALAFLESGKKVTGVAYSAQPKFLEDNEDFTYIWGDYNRTKFEEQFDLVWASHVLEHQLNANAFIRRLFKDCKDDGIVAITVPPLKHQIVGGHVSLWNPGLLLYNIVMARYDCSEAIIKQYGYNISVIVKKKPIKKMPKLMMDKDDIERLRPYFPAELFPEGSTAPFTFDGNFNSIGWN